MDDKHYYNTVIALRSISHFISDGRVERVFYNFWKMFIVIIAAGAKYIFGEPLHTHARAHAIFSGIYLSRVAMS